MSLHLWLTMLVAASIISISPGPGAVTTMNSSLNYGFRRAYIAILGLQAGWAAQIIIVAIGLGALIAASHTLYALIKYIGVAYLIYLGVIKWREGAGSFTQERRRRDWSARREFVRAMLIDLTNPKATVFLIAFMPQFLDPERAQLPQIAIICATLVAVDIVVMSGYNILSLSMKRWMRDERAMRIQNRIAGALLIGAALFLGLV
jgi:homoserine/homoserine lactone efflux protein